MTALELIPPAEAVPAPEWTVASWFNAERHRSLLDLRGQVVALHAFQMLCPGCVSHGIPQAQRIASLFAPEDVAVIGVHSVFEHHEAMQPVSLRAFLHEYRIEFPVAVDAAGDGDPIPKTMRAYRMRGTPTLILIDRQGRLRLHAFGRPDDLPLGAALATLLAEDVTGTRPSTAVALPTTVADEGCDSDGCSV